MRSEADLSSPYTACCLLEMAPAARHRVAPPVQNRLSTGCRGPRDSAGLAPLHAHLGSHAQYQSPSSNALPRGWQSDGWIGEECMAAFKLRTIHHLTHCGHW